MDLTDITHSRMLLCQANLSARDRQKVVLWLGGKQGNVGVTQALSRVDVDELAFSGGQARVCSRKALPAV